MNNQNSNNLELKITYVCRICLEQEFLLNNLINPCQCNGSLKYIHKKCFISWINKQNKLICEICRTNYRNLIIKSKQPNFLEWIKKEPEWIISSIINILPLIYDIYFMFNYSKLNFNFIESSRFNKPILIKLEKVNMSLFFSFYKLNFNLILIPITFPIELLNLFFFIRDACSRFKEFKRINSINEIEFVNNCI